MGKHRVAEADEQAEGSTKGVVLRLYRIRPADHIQPPRNDKAAVVNEQAGKKVQDMVEAMKVFLKS